MENGFHKMRTSEFNDIVKRLNYDGAFPKNARSFRDLTLQQAKESARRDGVYRPLSPVTTGGMASKWAKRKLRSQQTADRIECDQLIARERRAVEIERERYREEERLRNEQLKTYMRRRRLEEQQALEEERV